MRPEDIHDNISMFDIDAAEYPLLAEVKEYIQSTILRKGDCLFVPSFYWV